MFTRLAGTAESELRTPYRRPDGRLAEADKECEALSSDSQHFPNRTGRRFRSPSVFDYFQSSTLSSSAEPFLPMREDGAKGAIHQLMSSSSSIRLISALLLPFTLLAQDPLPPAGPHHRIVNTVREVVRPDGFTALTTNRYVQLEPGLNRLERDHWVPAQEGLEVVGDSVVSRGTAHRVIWAANTKAGLGLLDIELPGGERLRGGCIGLSYYDSASGRSVMLAEIKESTAELHQPNMVLFSQAFDDVDADLLYVCRKGTFEQFVVLRGGLPAPEDFQMDAATTRLEVVSEFDAPPIPRKLVTALREETDRRRRAAMVEPDLMDEELDFGSMFMGQGQAFLPAGEPWKLEAAQAIPMAKRWQVIEGRTVLFEAVEYPSLKPLLAQLKGASKPVATLRKPRMERMLPQRQTASRGGWSPPVASATPLPHGVYIDYTLTSSVTNFTFQSGATYFVTATVPCTGTNTTFEAGTVIKFSTNAGAGLELACTNVTWLGAPYRPVILTGSDDGSVGDVVTTNAFTGYYATTALNVKAPLTSVDLAHVRIRRAQTGIAFNQGYYHTVRHAQWVACQTGLRLSGSIVRLRNALMSDVKTDLNLTNSAISVEHLTVNGADLLNTGGTLYLTNSLLVGVAATNGWTGASNVFLSSASGVFASAAAGSNYLASGSLYRDAGTSAINTNLLKDLRSMTTVAPAALTASITTATTLGPQAERDTTLPDLGYHYDSLDYYATSLTVTNAALTLTNGVALGFYGSTFIWLREDAMLSSGGTPTTLNHLSPLMQVQEQPMAAYASSAPTVINTYCDTTHAPSASLAFTSFDNMSGYSVYEYPTSWRLANLDIRHSSFGAGMLYVEGNSAATAVTLVNNLFERHAITFQDTLSVNACNNLFRSGDSLYWNFATNAWLLKDNAFDGGTVDSYGPVTNGWNAYISATGRLMPTNAYDKVLTSFTYATGTLGRYYHSATNLIDAGSRTADDADLYHFTVQTTANSKDSGSVDIGFHYAGLDAAGLPIDTDSDGIPDLVEDFDGDGAVDSGETDWQIYNSANRLSGGTGLTIFTPLK